jgi:hypothetical protein
VQGSCTTQPPASTPHAHDFQASRCHRKAEHGTERPLDGICTSVCCGSQWVHGHRLPSLGAVRALHRIFTPSATTLFTRPHTDRRNAFSAHIRLATDKYCTRYGRNQSRPRLGTRDRWSLVTIPCDSASSDLSCSSHTFVLVIDFVLFYIYCLTAFFTFFPASEVPEVAHKSPWMT